MKAIKYIIRDREYFKKLYGATINVDEVLGNTTDFNVNYTLFETETGLRYEIDDLKGNKLNINDLNGYQKSILNECYKHFITGKGEIYGTFETLK